MYRFRAELKKNGELSISSNLQDLKIGEYKVYSTEITESSDKAEIVDIAKHIHGIIIKADKNEIVIMNDPFASIPVYIYCCDGRYIVDSVFENFKGLKLTVDRTGCYEKLMYEAGVFDRTPFNEIKEMPAASMAKYDISNKSLRIESYWDFNITCEDDIDENEAVDKVWTELSNIYRTYKGKDILMGMSGGLDSRLSLCLLKEVSEANSIKTFTFGHSIGIRDYKYASMICDKLELDKPEFIQLTDSTYREGMLLPGKTGGVYWDST